MLREITDSEWEHIQKQRERSDQFKKEVDECHALLKEKMKNVPTDMLECKYYTTDKMPDVVSAALLKEICRRRHEEREAFHSMKIV